MRINSPHINLITKACMKASRSLIRDFGEIENLQVTKKDIYRFYNNAILNLEKSLRESLLKARPDWPINPSKIENQNDDLENKKDNKGVSEVIEEDSINNRISWFYSKISGPVAMWMPPSIGKIAPVI